MEFSETPLKAEYDLIRDNGTSSYYSYEAILVTDKEELTMKQVVSIDFIRDYRNASADEILIKVVMPWGQYLNRVLPFKENLRMTIIRTPLSAGSTEFPNEPVVQSFLVYLPVEGETGMVSDSPETATEFSADLSGLKIVQLQLQEEAYSRSRSEMVGGVFRDTTPYNALIALLNNSIKNMDLDVDNAIMGIESVPPNNSTKRDNIVIPHGTPLVAVAEVLQSQCGGIYTAGIGCYLQKGFWHVWPLYNYKRYDEVEHTALFILAPSRYYRGVEHTWRVVDKHLSVFITGGVRRMDPSEALLLNEGNGTRFGNTDSMMEGFVSVEGNKAVASRSSNANEYQGIKRKGSPMSRVSQGMTQSNAFNEASKVAARNGAYLAMNWENSNPDLIVPGLQCEVGFLIEGRVVFLNAVVVHAHAYSALAGTGLHQKIHQTTTEVVVMVDRASPIYQKYLEETDQN